MITMVEIEFAKLDPDAKTPTKSNTGYELYSSEEIRTNTVYRGMAKTGIAIAIPDGWCGIILPQKTNSNGEEEDDTPSSIVLGSNYKGELLIPVEIHWPKHLPKHEKIAELVFIKTHEVTFSEVSSMEELKREKKEPWDDW